LTNSAVNIDIIYHVPSLRTLQTTDVI